MIVSRQWLSEQKDQKQYQKQERAGAAAGAFQ